jgi:hypothetical protein
LPGSVQALATTAWRSDRRGPSFIGSTTAGVVIGVNLAGTVDALDSNGLER